jgi:hypothetical protein
MKRVAITLGGRGSMFFGGSAGKSTMRKLLIETAMFAALVGNVHAATAGTVLLGGNWEGDFRRCWATKSFSQGTVRIISGETIDLDILWNDDTPLDKDTAISVRIDSKLIANGVTDGFDFKLGTHAILPALFRAKHLQISFPGKPERSVNLDIGAARKAVAFLKMCDKFWTCVAERDSPGKWPGKKKHCYIPRALDQYETTP